MKKFFLKKLWTDYYPGSATSFSQNTKISTFGSTNFYLIDSSFISLTSGAITLSSLTINLLIEKTSFYSCSSNNHGGAVFFSCSSGASVFHSICGEKCFTSGDNIHGSLIYIVTSISLRNEAHYLSCVRCPNSYSNGLRHSLYFQNGIQNLKNINSSLNIINHQTPGIMISSPNSVDSNYCTISNNKVGHSIAIWLSGGSGIRKLSQWNIVSNDSPSYSIIYDGGGYTMSNCIFKNNSNSLFPTSNLIVEFSKIIHYGFIGSPTFISSNTVLTNTFQINHFSSANCHADLLLTPNNTPPRTFMEIGTCVPITCKNIELLKLSNFLVLILNFYLIK